MKTKSTFRWNGMKKTSIPVAPPVVDLNSSDVGNNGGGSVCASVQRRSNNLKNNVIVDRNSLSSTDSSCHSGEGLQLSNVHVSSCDSSMGLENWLTNLQFEEYISLFIAAGYDMPTISRMTPADLTAIGITMPLHRQKLKGEIQKLNISDGIPDFVPKTLHEWLKIIRLEEYFDLLCQQEYDSIERVVQLTWEDFEDIGIKKLGHQKRLTLAIKRIQDLNNGVRRSSATHFSNLTSSIPSSSSLSSDHSSNSSCTDVAQPTPHNLSLPLRSYPLSQEVAINTSVNTKLVSPTLESPGTPELKTFQQTVPGFNGSEYGSISSSSCSSSLSKMSIIAASENNCNNDDTSVNPLPRTCVRGESLGSLNSGCSGDGGRDETDTRKITTYLHQYISRLQSQEPRQDCYRSPPDGQINRHSHYHPQGYESDCEPSYGRQGIVLQACDYETTATLNRPRTLIKNRPVAKIVANSRNDDDVNGQYQQQQSSPTDLKKVNIIPPHVEIRTTPSHCVSTLSKSIPVHSSQQHHNLYDDIDSVNALPPPPPPPQVTEGMVHLPNQISPGNSPLESRNSMVGSYSPSHSFSSQNSPVSLSIYATLKKNKVPPAPPKRTNSIKSGSSNHIYNCGMRKLTEQSQESPLTSTRCTSLDAIQERAFATCVKSLTSRFNSSHSNASEVPQLPSRNHKITPRMDDGSAPPPVPHHRVEPLVPHSSTNDSELVDYDAEDLPPPPPPDEPSEFYSAIASNSSHRLESSPMCSPEELVKSPESTASSVTSPTNGHSSDREASISTSSSTESMPFANDNIGTIKQRDYTASVKDSNISMINCDQGCQRKSSPTSLPIKSSPPSRHTSPSSHSSAPLISPSSPSSSSPVELHSDGNRNVSQPSLNEAPNSNLPQVNLESSPGQTPSSSSTTWISEPTNLIEDIELMLSNLSNQLDELLESEMRDFRK
ncbi:CRK like proto-oncogene, adaptor protein [Brevipalpus obovatus]|uniref:CRK like proto-oncogene, adaptor protein n=1 Tax=Brevipalpus obovatus TaxID=246614 RepID=UPI003D9EAF5D